MKAPGKGGDPRKFKDPHDTVQWDKLHSLPNLIYTDGNAFSLWQDGELVGSVIRLDGDIETSGASLKAPLGLLGLFDSFLRWQPIPPSSAKALAETTARLCRLLREEVTEQLELKSEVLTGLAEDWRKLLFPEASDERFADGYAQAVTFGLLMARTRGITLSTGLQQVANELSKTTTLIGAALKLLTDDASNQATLKTSLGTLTRVLDAVDWTKISKDFPEAWLYFYEDFLSVYDNTLRKRTGSYYTPPEVVAAMVALTDEALRSRFGLHAGLASPSVTLADPAVGTGTFLLGVLRKIATTIEADEGAGAVKAAVDGAVTRLIAFEMQLGPFAVAQLRILAEIVALTGAPPSAPMRMFVTDTLGNPHDDEGYFPQIVAAIAKSRKEANKVKREQPITVVIGNPPYREKSKGMGGGLKVSPRRPRRPRRSPTGCHRPNGVPEPTASTCGTSTSTSGGGQRGKSTTTDPVTRTASFVSSPSRGFSTGSGFRRCVTTFGGLALTSGSSIVPPRASSPQSTRAFSRQYSNQSASSWLPAPARPMRALPLTSSFSGCPRLIGRRSSQR